DHLELGIALVDPEQVEGSILRLVDRLTGGLDPFHAWSRPLLLAVRTAPATRRSDSPGPGRCTLCLVLARCRPALRARSPRGGRAGTLGAAVAAHRGPRRCRGGLLGLGRAVLRRTA